MNRFRVFCALFAGTCAVPIAARLPAPAAAPAARAVAAPMPTATPTPITLVRGYGTTVFFVPSPTPSPASTPFCASPKDPTARATKAPDFFAGAYVAVQVPPTPAFTCGVVAIAPTASGMQVSVALVPRSKPFISVTPVDGTPLSAKESQLVVDLTDADRNEMRLAVNPAGHLDQRTLPGGQRPVGASLASAGAAPGGAVDADVQNVFGGQFTVPWTASPFSACRVSAAPCKIKLSISLQQPAAGAVPASYLILERDVSLNVTAGFATATALPFPYQQRYVAGSYVESTSLSTPSGSPTPTVPLLQRLSGDANLPFSYVLAGMTANQNDAANQLLKAKTIAAVTATLPGTVPTAPPCPSCQSFQQIYGTVFTLAKGSDVASLLKGAKFGADDEPFTFKNIGNLSIGDTLQYQNGPLTLGTSYLHIAANGTTPQALLDGTFGASYTAGANTYNVLAASSNHAGTVPTPAPNTVPAAFPLPPHVMTYAGSWVADYAADTDRGAWHVATDTVPVLRGAYDATDAAFDGFAGLQWTRSTTLRNMNDQTWQSRVFSAMLGFRHADIAFQAPDGDPISLPGQSGFAGSVDYKWLESNALRHPEVAANVYSLSNPNGDVAKSIDWMVSYDASPIYGFSYENTQVWISEPLLAFQSLATVPTYPQLRALMARGGPTLVSTVLPLSDQTVTGSYTPSKDINLKVGYDFRHVSTTCYFPPVPISPFCYPSVSTSSAVTVAALVNFTSTLTLGGSYAPSLVPSGTRYITARRIYNAYIADKMTPCTTLLITASNDTGQLGTQNRLSRAVSAELDIEKFGWRHLNPLATLAVGYTDPDKASPGVATPVPPIGYILPYTASPTRQFFVKLRLGSPGFKQALSPGCASASI